MKARGFTLVEMLVAMLIFALIGMASHFVLSQMTSSDEISKEQQAALSELQFAMLMLERDVRQMVMRPVRAVQNDARGLYVLTDSSLLDSDTDGLAFVRAGWSNPNAQLPRSMLQPVVYRVRENMLQRVYNTYVDDVSARPFVQDLLPGVEDFRIEFEHQGQRLRNWQLEGQLPDVVIVRLTHEKYGLIERWFLTSGQGAVVDDEPA